MKNNELLRTKSLESNRTLGGHYQKSPLIHIYYSVRNDNKSCTGSSVVFFIFLSTLYTGFFIFLVKFYFFIFFGIYIIGFFYKI